jgi:hypothetical protein
VPLLGTRGGGSVRGFGRGASIAAAIDTGVMFEIGMVQVGSGGSSSVTFSSIPSTYKHLQLRVIGRTDRASSAFDAFLIKVNNDATTSNYTYHYLNGDGATATAGQENGSYGGAVVYRLPGSTATASIFGATITDILDYASTSKYKTLRSLGGQDLNGSSPTGEVYFGSNLWLSTTAISSLVIVPRTGTNFVQYSQFALYGIKG